MWSKETIGTQTRVQQTRNHVKDEIKDVVSLQARMVLYFTNFLIFLVTYFRLFRTPKDTFPRSA